MAIEGFHALGLAAACREELALKERQRGPSEADWVELFVGLDLAGGERLVAADPFRDGSPGVLLKDGPFSVPSCRRANNC